MRILALAIFAIGTVSIGPAAAQTYDPAYPVCLTIVSNQTFSKAAYTVIAPVRIERPQSCAVKWPCQASAVNRANCPRPRWMSVA